MAAMTRLSLTLDPMGKCSNAFFSETTNMIKGPGSHVGFLISAKKKNLVYDLPMNISATFGSNLFCGFRKKR
jgi:hypothetical protein